MTVAAAGGLFVYPEYRARIKQSIFQTAPRLGWTFERKEHLAFGAVLLAWVGALAYVASWGSRSDGPLAATLGRASRRSFACASALAAMAAAIGTAVAAYRAL